MTNRRNQRLCVRHRQTALSHHLSEPNLPFSHPSSLSSSLTEALSAPTILSAQNPSQAILSVIQRPLSLRFSQSRHLSQSPPPLSVAAITDSAQQFAAISSFYLPLFLSVRKLNWQQLVQISKRFLEQFAAFLPLSEIL
ncbi:hypothetical protein Pyn_08127 [Prunus yedoensis var. nudiflora]|uniref:Uncharacterized protein n=1 Tax=Prunus yedoensis var. nudiflora TaxID=2094558 RepID=A0A314ZEW4_PRUYE|nr:hypothetical protein Pyn_08127 [Prunus yedoensis var. nudiflora]